MSLQHAVLGVLEARSMSGYELTRFFESSARWVWSAPQSQIYPLLRRLEEAGFVEGEAQVRGERLKRVQYSITEAGIDELRSWLREDHDEPTPRDPLLLQAIFFDIIEPEEADAVLVEHIARLRKNIEQWAAHRALLLARQTPLLQERLARRDPADHQRVAALKAHAFDHLIDAATARIAWAQRTQEILHGVDIDPPAEPR